jgi:hypothetical protein
MSRRLFLGVAWLVLGVRRQVDRGAAMSDARQKLDELLREHWQSFDGITDQIERAADLVKELGGLEVLSEFDRARIAEMIETQIGIGISRGDFDFVFRRPGPIVVPEFQIARLDLAPGDVVVFRAPCGLSAEVRKQIEAVARAAFPLPRKILVLDGELELQVMKESQP